MAGEMYVTKYTSERKSEWDNYVLHSKNGTFLFYRDYLDYHSERFFDHSLILYKSNQPYAIFPANEHDGIIYSHQGLTYGGLITNNKVTTSGVLMAFNEINNYYRFRGIKKVFYKPTPYIYHKVPAQEDLYALFLQKNCKLIGRNLSSTICLSTLLPFQELRNRGIKKAQKSGVSICKSEDFPLFWVILENNLLLRYGVKPIHSIYEIELLHSRFPNEINLYLASIEDTPVAGCVVYDCGNTVHIQYISASEEGKRHGALDMLFDFLINNTYRNRAFFDFGQSTEKMGKYLNESLIFQKEGFGGRGVCYDTYEYDL